MAEPTGQEGADIAAAARERGMEQLRSAQGQMADGAERVAAAVERTAEDLEGEGDAAISGLGRSVASLMRQLAGGLRERDVEEFAREVGALARRNPGVFLAGCVALGFGISRFFKARSPRLAANGLYAERDWQERDRGWQDAEWRGSRSWQGVSDWDGSRGSADWRDSSGPERTGERAGVDEEDSLDLSATSAASATAAGTADDERSQAKSRQAVGKAQPQRASNGGTVNPAGDGAQAPATARPATEPGGETAASTDGASGGEAPRGGKS